MVAGLSSPSRRAWPIGVTTGVGVGVGVGLGVGVGVGLGVTTGVGVGLGVGMGVGVGVGVGVGLGVTTGVGEGVAAGGVGVGVGVGPGLPGTVGEARFCGFGSGWTSQSARFTLVSTPFPAVPPGDRSRLDPAAGAGAAAPSTKPFTASPHPIASTTAPPTTRMARAPPLAANPPAYVRSAPGATVPAALAMSTRRPAPSSDGLVQVALRVTVEPDEVT